MRAKRDLMKLGVLSLILLGLLMPNPLFGEEQEAPRYSLEALRRSETTVDLLAEAKEMREDLEKDLAKARAEEDDDEEDDIEDVLEVVHYAEEWLERALGNDVSEADRLQANAYCDRILQTVETPVEGQYLPGYHILFKNILIGATLGQPVQNVPKWMRERPVGLRKARKEAANLYDPSSESFYSVEQLATLSPEQIAALDISPENATWFDRESIATHQPDPVGRFESFLTDGMTAALHEDDDLKKDRRYSPSDARKVLFLEDIYLSATSPKGTTEDAFGVEWKLKWGDEPAMEPVASRLYVLAGGKMTDLSYTTGTGPSDMILILRDPTDPKKRKDDKQYPTSIKELKDAVMEFYEFDLAPYIHSNGTITEDNAEEMLANLPKGGKKKYKADNLIGRTWVAFREAGVELKTKGFVRRHDGSRMSDEFAVNDRAVRGLYLLDLWVGNRDVKDDNNQAFLLKSPDRKGEMKVTDYREGHHDMGLALGSLWSSGEVNEFPIGRQFARRGLLGKLRFRQATLFRPEAWDAATWADGKWMARNIVAITDEQIVDAVASSGWPDFGQKALVWKLVMRRNRLAEVYDLPVPSSVLTEAPSMAVALGSPAEIARIETRYRLPAGSLAEEVAKVSTEPGFVEPVLIDGEIVDCDDSALSLIHI